MAELTQLGAFALGSGEAVAAANGHLDFLRSELTAGPNGVPQNHMKLLASINRRTALDNPAVSPYCNVAYLNGDAQTDPTSQVFLEEGESVDFAMPLVVFGIDQFQLARDFRAEGMATFRGDYPPGERTNEEINEGLKRRP